MLTQLLQQQETCYMFHVRKFYIENCSMHDNFYINFSPDDKLCLDNCNRSFCMATYYSTKVRKPPQFCNKTCNNPADMGCLRKWARCVKKYDRKKYVC